MAIAVEGALTEGSLVDNPSCVESGTAFLPMPGFPFLILRHSLAGGLSLRPTFGRGRFQRLPAPRKPIIVTWGSRSRAAFIAMMRGRRIGKLSSSLSRIGSADGPIWKIV